MLTDKQIERRTRDMLARSGARLHKLRTNAPAKYIIIRNGIESEPLTLRHLIDEIERLEERRKAG